MAEQPEELDLEAVRETLRNAGLLPSERYLAAVNAELAEKGLEVAPQSLICSRAHYCIVIKSD